MHIGVREDTHAMAHVIKYDERIREHEDGIRQFQVVTIWNWQPFEVASAFVREVTHNAPHKTRHVGQCDWAEGRE
jgi:hypothetical protein